MKTFTQFMEDVQASVASNASVEDMESGELLSPASDRWPKRKKRKIQVERLSLEEFLAEEYA